jgi:hypothetical protein
MVALELTVFMSCKSLINPVTNPYLVYGCSDTDNIYNV